MDYEIVIITSNDNIGAMKNRIRFTKEEIKKAIDAAIAKMQINKDSWQQ